MNADRMAFLFLGETLLIPHLFPIVEALAVAAPGLNIDLWVSTSMHEALLSGWIRKWDGGTIRIRRAPGFRRVAAGAEGHNPPLPAKIPMLLRLAPWLMRVPVVVCAEQTSLWLPTLLPMKTRFIQTLHGAGSMNARDTLRRKFAWRTLVAGEPERDAFLARGIAPERVVTIGYVKSSFRQRTRTVASFAGSNPTLLYAPHWQRHRSSWWDWGADLVRRIVAQDRYNLIFAPHQRLIEKVPELRTLCAEWKKCPNVHCDLDSFAAVDGSHTAAADIYLGDTSSQVLEFLTRPRPCVFLNSWNAAWKDDPSYAMWACGDVVSNLDGVLPALGRARETHPHYVETQKALASALLGDTSGAAPARAAAEILAALHRQ